MLTYAKDMARAISSRRKMSRKLEQVQALSITLTKEFEQLFSDVSNRNELGDRLDQVKDLIQELMQLSGPESI